MTWRRGSRSWGPEPGRLTDEEFDLTKLHTVYGVELLAGVEFPWDLKPIIRWHHEKLDGTGYPDRLRGEEIPLAAQIIGIVDVFDARPCPPRWPWPRWNAASTGGGPRSSGLS